MINTVQLVTEEDYNQFLYVSQDFAPHYEQPHYDFIV